MILEIPVGKSRYKITCEETEQERLELLGKKLNKRVNELSQQMKYTDEKTLLVITALMLEEELEQSPSDKRGSNNDEDEEEKLTEEDVYNAVSENMENVARYIEKLTTKIQHY